MFAGNRIVIANRIQNICERPWQTRDSRVPYSLPHWNRRGYQTLTSNALIQPAIALCSLYLSSAFVSSTRVWGVAFASTSSFVLFEKQTNKSIKWCAVFCVVTFYKEQLSVKQDLRFCACLISSSNLQFLLCFFFLLLTSGEWQFERELPRTVEQTEINFKTINIGLLTVSSNKKSRIWVNCVNS